MRAVWMKEKKYETELNDWERNFVKTINKQVEEKGWLSQNQKEIMERIGVKVGESKTGFSKRAWDLFYEDPITNVQNRIEREVLKKRR